MLTRIISGLIGAICVAIFVQLGGIVFTIGILLLALGAFNEYSKMFKSKGVPVAKYLGILLTLLLVITSLCPKGPMFMLMLIVAVVMFKVIFAYGKFTVDAAITTLAGIFYIGIPFYHILSLRMMGNSVVLADGGWMGNFTMGTVLIWIALIGTWASDSFAYFVGSAIGKHRLCPNISPKKSIEGFVGGIVGTIICVEIVGYFVGFNPWVMALMGAGIAIIGTLGDLVESSIKRYTGIKDSGNLIPGHGGILDRFDSLLFTGPFVYYVALFLLTK